MMILQFTKIHILILSVLCVPLFNIDIYNCPRFEQSFLQSSPKKFNPPQGSFNYLLPTNTPGISSRLDLQRSGSIPTDSAHQRTNTNSRRRSSSVASGTRSAEPSSTNTVPFALPDPDYDNSDLQPPIERSRELRKSSSSLHAVPPEVLLPEPDYDASYPEGEPRKSPNTKSAIRRTLSKHSSFAISNLLANQASYIARRSFSKDGKNNETVEEKVARRRSLSLSKETFSPIDGSELINKPLSAQIPHNLISGCRYELAALLTLIKKLNLEVRKLKKIKYLIGNCNCGTKNCVMCQENFESYNSHKLSYTQLISSIESKTEFLTENCFSGQSNKYESAPYTAFFKELFSLLHDQIVRKNRSHIKNLFLRCEIVVISDKILKKQIKCSKCKKKREVCKKHLKLLQRLREIESAKNENKLEIEQMMGMIQLKIENLPERMVRELYILEEQDEALLKSHVKVRECMKKLSITSFNMSALDKIFKKNNSSKKKKQKRKSSSGSIATRPSPSRPGFIEETSTNVGGSTQTTPELPPSASSRPTSVRQPSYPDKRSSHKTSKTSRKLSTRAASISRRTPSGASRRTISPPSTRGYSGFQSPYPSLQTGVMGLSPMGPFSAPDSGAIPKVRSSGSAAAQQSSSHKATKKKSDHKNIGKASRS
ncbi:putative Secreted Protein [Cryptosporidium tyzzeri]|nr:putative Secreted Protein [Cryptosporidium tyzzeri]